MLSRAALPFLLVVLGACASGSGAASTARSSQVITEDDLNALDVATAYEVVQRLRPGWLRGRGPASISGAQARPLVYIDGIRSGGIEALENVHAGIITEIRFMSGRDASVAYGLDHGGGVIEVETGG